MVRLTAMLRTSMQLVGVIGGLGAMACEPAFDDRNSEVLDRRILAIRSDPAQAKPGATIELSGLVVEPSGTLRNFPLDWAFCNAAKPVAETNDVSAACLARAGDELDELGKRASVTGQMPKDACRLFGSDVPPSKAGEPAGRPTDPDATGSYYEPVRVIADGGSSPIFALAQVGLVCGLPTLTGEQQFEYQKRVRLNEHPKITSVVVGGDEKAPLSVDDGQTAPIRVKPGERVPLRVTWPACPSRAKCGDGICGADEDTNGCPDDCTTPHGCAGAEDFVYYDPLAKSIVDRREAMRVSWFAGAGSYDDDHTGRREDELETFSDGVWTAPSESGPVHLWVVLRDSRGGTDWQSYIVDVE